MPGIRGFIVFTQVMLFQKLIEAVERMILPFLLRGHGLQRLPFPMLLNGVRILGVLLRRAIQ